MTKVASRALPPSRRRLVMAVAALLASLFHANAAAYSPSPPPKRPAPWLRHEVRIDPASLPAGITLEPDGRTLVNSGARPFYLVRESTDGRDWGEALPDNALPRYRIVSGQVFQYRYAGGWRDRIDLTLRGGPMAPRLRMHSLEWVGLLPGTEIEVLGQYGPNRPTAPDVPGPISLVVEGYYGGRPVSIPMTLKLKLNGEYGKSDRYWYTPEALLVESDVLPAGIRVMDRPAGERAISRVPYGIANESDTPFYLVSSFREPLEWLHTLPDNAFPFVRLVEGRHAVASWNFLFRQADRFWQRQTRPGYELEAPYISVLNTSFRLPQLKVECHPVEGVLPKAIPFSLVAFQGRDRHVLTGRIDFVRDPDFTALPGVKAASDCEYSFEYEFGSPFGGTPIGTAPKSDHPCTPDLAGIGTRGRGVCYDYVAPNWRGPLMVVVPSGGAFPAGFAIGKYEVSVGDWSKFCAQTGKCKPMLERDRHDDPVTGITLEEVKVYLQWLSERTRENYRLPDVGEWNYAATVGGTLTDDSAELRKLSGQANCRVLMGDKVVKGTGTVDVSSGEQNAWGLKNFVGNVQEWVLDGSGSLLAAGGHYRLDTAECRVGTVRPHDGGADPETGFRVLREIPQ